MDQILKDIRKKLKTIDSSRFPIAIDPPIYAQPTDKLFTSALNWAYIQNPYHGYVSTHSNMCPGFAACPISSFNKNDRLKFLKVIEKVCASL